MEGAQSSLPDEPVPLRSEAESAPAARPQTAARRTRGPRSTRGQRTAPAVERAPESRPGDLSQLSDLDLLEGIRRQDQTYFGELYNRYFQRIYNFVYGRLRNHADTEEVVQETFVAVFRSFENYRGQSSLLSWIYGVAKNSANNHLRRLKVQQTRLDQADQEDLQPRPSIGRTTPEESFELDEYRRRVDERLGELSDWQVRIFVMRHFENRSIPEISRRMNRSSDAVRSSLYRVKKMLFDEARLGEGEEARW